MDILEGFWTMLTAGDLLSFVGGLLILALSIVFAPVFFVANLIGEL